MNQLTKTNKENPMKKDCTRVPYKVKFSLGPISGL